MVDAALSQDEINELLAGVEIPDTGENAGETKSLEMNDGDFIEFEKIAKQMASTQANSLSSISTKDVDVSVLSCHSGTLSKNLAGFEGGGLIVRMEYTFPSSGMGFYLLKKNDALQLANLMIGSKALTLDDMSLSALEEAFNQIVRSVDSVIGSKVASNGIALSIDSIPNTTIPEDKYIIVKNSISIDSNINFEYLQFYTLPLANAMINSSSKNDSNNKGENFNMGEKDNVNVENLISGGGSDDVNIHGVEFSPLGDSQNQSSTSGNIDLLLDVSMEVTVELGRATKTIQEILSLGEGSIIELDNQAGEPVDLLVNGKPIAKGEVVVIDENFGVRVTKIVSPKQRITTNKNN